MVSSNNTMASAIFYLWNFEFEEQFPLIETSNWMKAYWSISVVLVVIYIAAIYFGVGYMHTRSKFNLRGPLFAWNTTLTLVYACGVYRSTSEVFSHFRPNGFYSFVCEVCGPNGCTKASQLWAWVFVMLKAPELLDTAFVVLRKQPLFFLHWYHHCTVLVFTWYLFSRLSSAGSMFAIVNAVVHALMYFYYALKALSIRIPRSVSMALTLIQLSQMIVGFYTNYYVLQVKRRGVPCDVTYTDIVTAFLIYSSYFILFLWYFYKAYIVKDAIIIAKFKGEKIE